MSLYSNPEDHTYLYVSLLNDEHHMRIVKNLLESFGVRAGDKVLEVGAGVGRYTEALLALGVKVRAAEPDAAFRRKLEERFGSHAGFETSALPIEETIQAAGDVQAVCGFHVLHHLPDGVVTAFVRDCRALAGKGLRSWFFLEPSPFNPLYPFQILFTPAMHFSDEKGQWRNVDRLLPPGGAKTAKAGYTGIFPPLRGMQRLPQAVTAMGTGRVSFPNPLSAYAVFGERFGA